MAGKGFTHLHLHSQYSLLDGAITFERLLERCKKLKMDSVAVTDHGNIFRAVEFYIKATAAGIKPIIGSEVYIAPKSRFEKDFWMSPMSPSTVPPPPRPPAPPPAAGRSNDVTG